MGMFTGIFGFSVKCFFSRFLNTGFIMLIFFRTGTLCLSQFPEVEQTCTPRLLTIQITSDISNPISVLFYSLWSYSCSLPLPISSVEIAASELLNILLFGSFVWYICGCLCRSRSLSLFLIYIVDIFIFVLSVCTYHSAVRLYSDSSV